MPKRITAKARGDPLNPAQVLRVMAGKPNELELATGLFQPGIPKSKTAAAAILGCTVRKLNQTLAEIRAAPAGTAIADIRTSGSSRGRPWQVGPELISPEGLQHITSRPVLRSQVGWTLTARAQDANERFGCTLSRHQLRRIYSLQGVTKQRVQPAIAPRKYRPDLVQIEQLQDVANEVQRARADGFEILQYDQCVFSANKYNTHQWAPVREPLTTLSKWGSAPVVVVCGFISEQSGKVYFPARQQKSFNGESMAEFLLEIRTKMLPGKKLAFFGDNARINIGKKMKAAAAQFLGVGSECRLLFNQPYRPDLSKCIPSFLTLPLSVDGIEHCWGFCKRIYKQKIQQLRVNQEPVDNLAVVTECLEALDTERCSRIAAAGWRRLAEAMPVQPESPANVPEPSEDDADSQIREAGSETSSEDSGSSMEVDSDIDWEKVREHEMRLWIQQLLEEGDHYNKVKRKR